MLEHEAARPAEAMPDVKGAADAGPGVVGRRLDEDVLEGRLPEQRLVEPAVEGGPAGEAEVLQAGPVVEVPGQVQDGVFQPLLQGPGDVVMVLGQLAAPSPPGAGGRMSAARGVMAPNPAAEITTKMSTVSGRRQAAMPARGAMATSHNIDRYARGRIRRYSSFQKTDSSNMTGMAAVEIAVCHAPAAK